MPEAATGVVFMKKDVPLVATRYDEETLYRL